MRSVFDNVAVVHAILPTTLTGAGTPAAAMIRAIDTFGFNSGMISVGTGSMTGTALNYVLTLQLQECATSGGTYTNVSGATATITVGTATAAGMVAQIRVDDIGTTRLRYLKVMATSSGYLAGAALPVYGVAALGRAFVGPQSNSSTVTG